jgi:hypothetical protein
MKGMEQCGRDHIILISVQHDWSTAALGNVQAGIKKAGHSYGNNDVERQNQNNGAVKYRGKSENIGS